MSNSFILHDYKSIISGNKSKINSNSYSRKAHRRSHSTTIKQETSEELPINVNETSFNSNTLSKNKLNNDINSNYIDNNNNNYIAFNNNNSSNISSFTERGKIDSHERLDNVKHNLYKVLHNIDKELNTKIETKDQSRVSLSVANYFVNNNNSSSNSDNLSLMELNEIHFKDDSIRKQTSKKLDANLMFKNISKTHEITNKKENSINLNTINVIDHDILEDDAYYENTNSNNNRFNNTSNMYMRNSDKKLLKSIKENGPPTSNTNNSNFGESSSINTRSRHSNKNNSNINDDNKETKRYSLSKKPINNTLNELKNRESLNQNTNNADRSYKEVFSPVRVDTYIDTSKLNESESEIYNLLVREQAVILKSNRNIIQSINLYRLIKTLENEIKNPERIQQIINLHEEVAKLELTIKNYEKQNSELNELNIKNNSKIEKLEFDNLNLNKDCEILKVNILELEDEKRIIKKEKRSKEKLNEKLLLTINQNLNDISKLTDNFSTNFCSFKN